MTPGAPTPPEGRYQDLIRREARHWAGVGQDRENPQLWDDPALDAIALQPAYRHLVERAVLAGGPVLELGCGEGELALELAGRGLAVHAVDLAPERIARARESARAAGLEARTRFEIGDLNRLELPGAAYACVVAHDALHHIVELDRLLDRVRGSLRPGGRLLISDFIGAGTLEKLLTAAVVGALPTVQSYARKWRQRGRIAALIAGEREKRMAIAGGADALLHDASPFEGISQASIARRIGERFEIVEQFSFCPFWYHAVPKLRIPAAWRRAVLATAQRWDRALHRRGWTRGSYVFVEAAAGRPEAAGAT